MLSDTGRGSEGGFPKPHLASHFPCCHFQVLSARTIDVSQLSLSLLTNENFRASLGVKSRGCADRAGRGREPRLPAQRSLSAVTFSGKKGKRGGMELKR